MTDLMDICSYSLRVAEKLGCTQTEAVAVSNKSTYITIEKDEIKCVNQGSSSILAVRLFLGKSMGICTVVPVKKESVEEVVRKAISLARSSPPDPMFSSLPGPKPFRDVTGLFDPEVATLSSEDLVEDSVLGIENAKAVGEVDISGGASISVSDYHVANSLGVSSEKSRTNLSYSIEALANRSGETTIGFDYFSVTNLKEEQFEKVGKEAAKKAIRSLGSKKASSGNYTLVLDERTSLATVSSIVGFGANAYNVMRGSSYYIDRMDTKIGCDILTVKDEPLYPKGINSCSFDAEGYPCVPLTLVSNGILKAYYTDSYTADNLRIANTGRAMRDDLGSRPRPGLTNVQIEKGELTDNELFEDIKLGLFIYDSELTPAGGTSNISSLVDHGLLIENGELKNSVKDTMIGSTVFEIIQNIEGCSMSVLNESGQISPKLRIQNIRVTGGA